MNQRRNLQTRKNRRKRNERWESKSISFKIRKDVRVITTYHWAIVSPDAKVMLHAE